MLYLAPPAAAAAPLAQILSDAATVAWDESPYVELHSGASSSTLDLSAVSSVGSSVTVYARSSSAGTNYVYCSNVRDVGSVSSYGVIELTAGGYVRLVKSYEDGWLVLSGLGYSLTT